MGIFAVVRPYDDGFRKHVFEFLAELGFEPGVDMALSVGSPDAHAAAWLAGLSPAPGLLLIPFHQHADSEGNNVDGLSLLEHLPEQYIDRRTPILMPVSDFAFAGSFSRRLEELRMQNPAAADLLIPMPPSQLGDDKIRGRIEQLRE